MPLDLFEQPARDFAASFASASAAAIAESATNDEDQEKVRTICRNLAGFKLGKFDSIYDEYA